MSHHHFLTLNGITCRTADGAAGFRPCDVFAGQPLQRCAAEDCPQRSSIRGGGDGSAAGGVPGSPAPLFGLNRNDDSVGADSDCAVFNTFGVLTGGVLLDVTRGTFVDYTASTLVVPGTATATASANADEPRKSGGGLVVMSSLTPYNVSTRTRVARKRQRRAGQEARTGCGSGSEIALSPPQLRYVVEGAKKPAQTVPPEIVFPLQHSGALLSRAMLANAGAPSPSAFTCFSGRPVWRRPCGPRRDAINSSSRPQLATALTLHFRDALHPTVVGTTGTRPAAALRSKDRLTTVPPNLDGWSLHWWVFSRFIAYLAIDTNDSPAVLPVTEHDTFYMAQASRALQDIESGVYRRPSLRDAARCWHLLTRKDPLALQLRLRRFEVFFRFASAKKHEAPSVRSASQP